MTRVRSTIAIDELRPIAAQELPDMPIDEPRAATSFLATAIEFAIGWFKAHEQAARSDLRAAILIAAEYPRRTTATLPAQASTLLRQDFVGDHYGRAFVCNDAITIAMELQGAPRTMVEAGRYVQANRLGALPTIVLVPANRSVTMYWHGLDDEESSWELHVAASAPQSLTQHELVGVLDAVWDNALASPQPHYDVVWKNRDQFVAFGQAERRVQHILIPILRVEFRENFVVRPEDRQPSGRIDVSIAPRRRGVTGVGTIELKALCSRRESSRPAGFRPEGPAVHKAAIKKGLGQAVDAKRRLSADIAILACYDLRKEPQQTTAFAKEITKQAKLKGIVLEHYPLYASAELRRQAEQAPVRRVAEGRPRTRSHR
jgi:hypothetical protein